MKLYHVTFQTNIPKILGEGIRSNKRRVWANMFGERLGKQGIIYAYDKYEQAYRWAYKQWWDFNKDVAIVEFIDDNFIEDPDGGFVGGLIKFGNIEPQQIKDVFMFEFKKRNLHDVR